MLHQAITYAEASDQTMSFSFIICAANFSSYFIVIDVMQKKQFVLVYLNKS